MPVASGMGLEKSCGMRPQLFFIYGDREQLRIARQGTPLEEDITPQAGAAGVLVISDAFPEIQG